MATTLTTSYQTIDYGNLTWTYEGTSYTARVEVQAKYSNQSGNTARIDIRERVTLTSPSGWTWYGSNKYRNINGEGWVQDNSNLVTGTAHEWTTSINNVTGGTTRSVSAAYRVMSTEKSVSGDVLMPTFTTPPTGLAVSVQSKTHNSATLSISVSSYGLPASASGRYIEGAILGQNSYSGSRRYAQASNVSSANVTINNSSSTGGSSTLTLTGNTKYWYGIYANNTQETASKVQGEIYLPCPPLSALAQSGSYTYTSYNQVSATISYTRASDGGAETRTGQYRYSTNGGTSWVGWNNFGTVTNTTGTFTISLPTSTNILLQARLSTPNGGTSEAISTTFTTPATHTINFSDFEYQDTNPDTIAITGDDQVLIQKQSIPQVTVPVEDKATITDGVPATLTKYTATLNSESIDIPYSSSQDVSGTFTRNSVFSSGSKSLAVAAKDSLNASKNVYKTVEILPWAEPSIEASYTRIDQQGHIQLEVSGIYSPLTVGGEEKNTIKAYYKIDNGELVEFEIEADNGVYSGVVRIDEIDYSAIYYLSVIIEDVFSDSQVELEVSNIEEGKKLHPVEYTIEVWDWKTNSYLMDLSHIVMGNLNIKWTLNDIEEINFDIDLATFERYCGLLGRDPRDMLVPYIHDIRIRRNGVYIVGCQIVEANISLSENQDPRLTVRATGYLNLFKDRYIDAPWAGYSYSEIAKKLITAGQRADSLIRNPTIDIDTSYWLPVTGAIAKVSASPTPHGGAGCLKLTNSTAGGHLTIATQMNVPAGKPIQIDLWMQSSAAVTIYERQYATQSSNQRTIATYSTSVGANWTHWTLNTYTTYFENGYLVIDSTNGGNAGYYMAIDDITVFRVDDDDALYDFNVSLGTDTATSGQDKTRIRNYELQNIKDAIMDLVNLEDDNFDFEFTYDRVFNLYAQKGEVKTDLSLDYPGNVSALEIEQSASDLANKIQNIGSGIGDERIEVWASDASSRIKYGTRESVVTNNNVSLTATLSEQAEGLIRDSKEISRILSITVSDGSVNCENLKTGDIIPFRIGHKLLTYGYTIIGQVEGWYRVKAVSVSVDKNSVESLKLTLELIQGFRDVTLSYSGTGTSNVPGYGGLATYPLGPTTIKSSELPYYVEKPTMASGYTFAGWTCPALGITTPTQDLVIPRSASGSYTLVMHCSDKISVDVNAVVNGQMVYSNIPATFDIYINGTKVSTAVRDYGNDGVTVGSTFEIRNITPDSGYTYTGASVLSYTIDTRWRQSFNDIRLVSS